MNANQQRVEPDGAALLGGAVFGGAVSFLILVNVIAVLLAFSFSLFGAMGGKIPSDNELRNATFTLALFMEILFQIMYWRGNTRCEKAAA